MYDYDTMITVLHLLFLLTYGCCQVPVINIAYKADVLADYNTKHVTYLIVVTLVRNVACQSSPYNKIPSIIAILKL